MKKYLTVILLAASVVACSKNPQERFAEICAKETNEAKRNSCLCTGQELSNQLSKEKYAELVDELEKAQTGSGSINFSSVIKSDVLDQDTITAFISSAKKCGPAR